MKHYLPHKSSFLKGGLLKFKKRFFRQPLSSEDFQNLIQIAINKSLLDIDTSKMLGGVLAISKMQVRDIMIPRSQMIVLEQNESPESLIKIIAEASHSRFPIVDESKDNVIGMLLVKDFMKTYVYEGRVNFDLKSILRPVFFVPESKRLDSLLKEFKENHSHLAIVVDEYGGIAGLITIEDILEEIVGDIEDEFDEAIEEDMQKLSDHVYQVNAITSLEDLNKSIGTQFSDEEVGTIGGLLSRHLGHIPHTGEAITLENWKIQALSVDSRRALRIELSRNPDEPIDSVKLPEETPRQTQQT